MLKISITIFEASMTKKLKSKKKTYKTCNQKTSKNLKNFKTKFLQIHKDTTVQLNNVNKLQLMPKKRKNVELKGKSL